MGRIPEMPNYERCPNCGKFTDSSGLDVVIDLDAMGEFAVYCSWKCHGEDVNRLRGEEPEIIY
jgi:hypothetical protein